MALHAIPADFLINAVAKAEAAVSPYTLPIQDFVCGLLESAAPAQYVAGMRWFASAKSVHAEKLPLMNVMHVVLIILAYLAVIAVGKAFMEAQKDRLDVKFVALVHNFNMVALSSYMCGAILYEAYCQNYSVFMNAPDETEVGWTVCFPPSSLFCLH